MAHNILLEAGTNEIELLTFRLGGTPFGVNVAKVREIIQKPKTLSIPHAPETVEGCFKLRERVLTLVNLGRYFQMETDESSRDEGLIIVVEFNNVYCGILVDHVDVIRRLGWDMITPPSQYLVDNHAPVTGTVNLDDTTVLVIDFESIVDDILGIPSPDLPPPDHQHPTTHGECRIVMADDSSVVRQRLEEFMRESGFDNVTFCSNGEQAWNFLQEHRNDPGGPCELVISDIEMPSMDGLHLTRRIKEDSSFADIPVIMLSSLITPDNIKKCQAVGADAYIRKSQTDDLFKTIEQCLAKRMASAELV